MLDLHEIRKDFPILNQKIYGNDLVYFDNGATTQKPVAVINAISQYYQQYNSNVHRGVHFLSQKATDAQEAAREYVASFINASDSREIIFTRGTTESINLVAYSFCKTYMQAGDEIILTMMEHHSNIVPWQIAAQDRGLVLKFIPLLENGTLDLSKLPELITERTKLIALTYVSNTLGVVNPVKEVIELAHRNNIKVLVDGAQAVQHMKVDVQELDADFFVFSGHKVYGPTGIGVLYGKYNLMDAMQPYQGGGSMIETVELQQSTYAPLPFKFEAGTPDVAGIIGLHAALEYVDKLGLEHIAQHEAALIAYALEQIRQIEGINVYAEDSSLAGAISFNVGMLHPFDIGDILDKLGIAVRTGHHCCKPIMDFYHIPGTIRVSFGLYNTKEEVDVFIGGLNKAIKMLQ